MQADRLHYRFLATWQRSFGTYDDLYREPQETVSLLGEASYRLPKGCQLKVAIGLDTGKTYGQNFGVQTTIMKTF